MSLIALHQWLHRSRRKIATTLAVVGVVGALLAAHSALGERHMAMGVDQAAMVCLAILAVAALPFLGVRRARESLRRPSYRPPVAPAPRLRVLACPARAGPAHLQVFRR